MGPAYTVMPLLSRDLLVVIDECVQDAAADWPEPTWVVDVRKEDNRVPISTLPPPPVEKYGHEGGRFGSHDIHENRPGPSLRDEELIYGCFLDAGVRVYDIVDPYRPEERAHFVPPGEAGSRVATAQMNDI